MGIEEIKMATDNIMSYNPTRKSTWKWQWRTITDIINKKDVPL